MGNSLTTTRSSVKVYNLVSTAVDGTADSTEVDILSSGPVPETSANEIKGMFLRSRIDWTNAITSSRPAIVAKAGSSSVGVANIFQVIEIPDRAVLHELMLAAPGDTAPTHGYTGNLGGSPLLYFGVAAYTNASKSTLKFDADGLGRLAVTTTSGGAMTGLPTISASYPETRMKAVTTSSVGTPIFCPYGGFVEMQFTAGSSTSALSVNGVWAGTMELIVRASKLPE